MSKPAARVGDMHVCPMVTPGMPPVPHVGGPITGPGCPTVLIGNMPAAVMGDMCTCVGPPSSVVLGSTGVFFGGKPAARMGDMTAHGGSITVGFPTVIIGEMSPGGYTGANSSGMAAFSVLPLKQQKVALRDLDKMSKKNLSPVINLIQKAKKGSKYIKSKIGWSSDYKKNKLSYDKSISDASIKYSEKIGMPPKQIEKILKTIMYIESKGDSQVVSKTKCTGLFQFNSKTAKSLGLINDKGDFRKDPHANIDAAARLLIDSANQLKNKSIPVTGENLYFIHQQGASLGTALLRAKEDKSLDKIELSQKQRDALDVNGGKGKNPSEFLNMWSSKYEDNSIKVEELETPLNLDDPKKLDIFFNLLG